MHKFIYTMGRLPHFRMNTNANYFSSKIPAFLRLKFNKSLIVYTIFRIFDCLFVAPVSTFAPGEIRYCQDVAPLKMKILYAVLQRPLD